MLCLLSTSFSFGSPGLDLSLSDSTPAFSADLSDGFSAGLSSALAGSSAAKEVPGAAATETTKASSSGFSNMRACCRSRAPNANRNRGQPLKTAMTTFCCICNKRLSWEFYATSGFTFAAIREIRLRHDSLRVHSWSRSAASFPRFRGRFQCHAPALALDDNVHRLADLHGVQRVGVVVNVRDLLSGELDNDVAALEAGFFRRAAAAHARQFDALHFGGVIGDGAEISAQGVAPAAPVAALDLHVIRPRLVRGKVEHEAAREARDALQPFVIHLVRDIGGPMIVIMAAGEEGQHRNLFRIERRGIGRQIRVVLQDQIEAGRQVALFNQSAPPVGRADALQGQLVVAQPAYHVKVQISDDVRESQQRMFREISRAEQPKLFAG